MKNTIIYIFILFFSFSIGWAVSNNKSFSDESLNKYRKDKRFNYSGKELSKPFEEKTFKDGTILRKYEDGSKEEIKPDGTVITTSPNGLTVEKKPDGTITTYKEDGGKVTEHPDGTITWEKKDGTVITKKNNGTFIEKRTDGHVYEIDPVTIEQQDSTGFSINLGGPFTYLIAFAFIGTILFIILKSIKNNNTDNNSFSTPLEEEHENLENIVFESEIDSYLRVNDYKNATRYYFLQSLKVLQDKELITWKKDKTNRDYYHEIQNLDIKNNFETLGFIFEFAWYGNNNITKDQMFFIQKKFNDFNLLVKE